jgi:hypothetical protein
MANLPSGYTQFPRSGQLGAKQSPTGAPLQGTPGYLVSDLGNAGAPDLAALEAAYYSIGGPDVNTNAYLVTDVAQEIAPFDASRASLEIYNDDSSADACFIGGPYVAPVNGQTQANAGLRLNPGSGRIYDGADRAKRIWAVCAAGQTAVVVVALTPTVATS